MEEAVRYPSYVDLDPYIDVARLRGLDGYISERLRHRISEADLAFYTGPFLLSGHSPRLPGASMVHLSRSSRTDHYYDLDRTDLWSRSEDASDFPELMAFIDTLPFKAVGRMLIIYDPDGRAVSAHRDHDSADLCHEFIWFRTNFAKPFYMLNPDTSEALYVKSHAAWFDTVNQFHGADPSAGLSFSIRVDGVFADAFRARIPFPAGRRSAAASVWAAQQSQRQDASLRRCHSAEADSLCAQSIP